MGDLLHNVIFFHLAFDLEIWNMTDASSPAYILPSRFRKDDIMPSNIAILQQTLLSPYQEFGEIVEGGDGDNG